MGFNLFSEPAQRLTEEFLDFAAAETDNVCMLLFAPRLVVVLLARMMHQVKLVNQTAFLQELQRAVHGDAVQLRIALAGELAEAIGIEMFAGFVEKIEQDFALAREAHTACGRGRFSRSARG